MFHDFSIKLQAYSIIKKKSEEIWSSKKLLPIFCKIGGPAQVTLRDMREIHWWESTISFFDSTPILQKIDNSFFELQISSDFFKNDSITLKFDGKIVKYRKNASGARYEAKPVSFTIFYGQVCAHLPPERELTGSAQVLTLFPCSPVDFVKKNTGLGDFFW